MASLLIGSLFHTEYNGVLTGMHLKVTVCFSGNDSQLNHGSNVHSVLCECC